MHIFVFRMLKPNHDFCPTLNKIFQFFLCLFLDFYFIIFGFSIPKNIEILIHLNFIRKLKCLPSSRGGKGVLAEKQAIEIIFHGHIRFQRPQKPKNSGVYSLVHKIFFFLCACVMIAFIWLILMIAFYMAYNNNYVFMANLDDCISNGL